jgi:cell division protein FtsL
MSKRGSVLLLVVMFAAVTGAALAHVSLRLGVVRLGYAIGAQTREHRALEQKHRKLQTELASLKRPDRIEAIAREKLGMTLPDPAHIRTLRPGTQAVAAVGGTTGASARP